MKPLNKKNYGSIPHLSNSKLGEKEYHITDGQEKILTIKKRDKYDVIFAYEKYDGSNVGICKVNNKIFALTRSGYQAKTSPYIQHHIFDDWVCENNNTFKELLKNGERIVGEWMVQAHGMIYDIKNDPILFFDLFNSDNERVSQDELNEKTEKYNFNMPRLLHKGDSVNVNILVSVLNLKTNDICSKENPEGIVYRCERKHKVDFLAKWVRLDYPTGRYLNNKIIFNNYEKE